MATEKLTSKKKAKRYTRSIAQIKRDNRKLKDKFLEYFEKLPIQKLAADYIGKAEDTITNWKKEDKEFSDQIAKAKSEWALDKVGKVRSKEWLLERIMKDHFTEKIEHGMDHEITEALDRLQNIIRPKK